MQPDRRDGGPPRGRRQFLCILGRGLLGGACLNAQSLALPLLAGERTARVVRAVDYGLGTSDGREDDTAGLQRLIDEQLRDGDTLVLGPCHRLKARRGQRRGFQARSTLYVAQRTGITLDARHSELFEDAVDGTAQGVFTFRDCRDVTVLVDRFRGRVDMPGESFYSGFLVACDRGVSNLRLRAREVRDCHGGLVTLHQAQVEDIRVEIEQLTHCNYGVTLRGGHRRVTARFAIDGCRRAFFIHGDSREVDADYRVANAYLTALRLGVGGGAGPIRDARVRCRVVEGAAEYRPQARNRIEAKGVGNQLLDSHIEVVADLPVSVVSLGDDAGFVMRRVGIKVAIPEASSASTVAPFTIGGVQAEPFEAVSADLHAGVSAVAGQPARRTVQVRNGRGLRLRGRLHCAEAVGEPLLIDDVAEVGLDLETYHAGGGRGAVLRYCRNVTGRLVTNGRLAVSDSRGVSLEVVAAARRDEYPEKGSVTSTSRMNE
ncbi:hypothetical protein [Halomonas mongoliensis]|uniref:hypothetical protein n=1 Tax=Halomonas mongoliensis TaxID=321265 RepID=UPI00403AC30C